MNIGGSVHPKSVDNLGNALSSVLGVVRSNGLAGNTAEPRPIHGYFVVLHFVQVCWNKMTMYRQIREERLRNLRPNALFHVSL